MWLRSAMAVFWFGWGVSVVADDGYHVIVLAPQTPVVVHVAVEFDEGTTIADNRLTYADRWFQRLDRDNSETLDASEATRVPSFGRFEEIPGQMLEEWSRLDIAPANGQLSRKEMLAHVNAAMGSGLSIKRPRRPATQTVILHPRLDGDGDGQVSIDELLTGLSALSPFDFDDDQSLSAAELQPFPRSMRGANEFIDEGETPFVTLDESTDVDALAHRLISQYGRGNEISPDAIGIDDKRVRNLDINDDGQLNSEELRGYLSEPMAEMRMTLHFPSRRLKRLQAGDVTRPDAVVIREESTRRQLVTQMGGLNVEAEIQDARGSFNSITQRFRSTQFGIADRDRDDALTPEEFGRLEIENITFTAVDGNADGQVSMDEFLEFVDLRALLAQCRLEMTVENETTSLFETLDTDEDYRLSPREFEQGVEPLQSLDRNGNDKLAESELVTRYTLAFAITRPAEFDDLVGSVGFNQMSDETQLPIVRPVTRGPEWFRKMDRNQDGDVTWREFLGPRETFDRLDEDGNGLIDDSEAAGQ